MKYFIPYLFLILIFSCKENGNNTDQRFVEQQKGLVKENLKVLGQLEMNYGSELQANSYRDHFDDKIYFTATRRYFQFLKEFELRLNNLKIADTLNLNKYYTEKTKEVSAFTDSIKALEGLKLFEEDKKDLLFVSRSDLKKNPCANYELLRLLYLQDFKTQILNAVSIIHPIYGCLKITYPKFYDFIVIQNNMSDDKKYTISIKGNYLFKQMSESDYFITFKNLAKISNNDTVSLNENIVISDHHKLYKTTDIKYEKGKYLLVLNMNIKLPSGLVKVDEMNFEYELK